MSAAPLFITGAAVLVPASGRIPDPQPAARFDKTLLRRTSRLGRLALAVVEAALQEAGVTSYDRLGLVVGTGLADLDETAGFLEGVHQRGPEFASPQNFQRSVHSAVAGEIAIMYGLKGYNLTVTDGLASGEAALFQAMSALEAGRCDRCLCVAVDGVSKILISALAVLGLGHLAGEGAAAVVLDHTRARGLAQLLGVDLAAAERSEMDLVQNFEREEDAVRELGLHGAIGLVKTVLALRKPNFGGLPAAVRLQV